MQLKFDTYRSRGQKVSDFRPARNFQVFEPFPNSFSQCNGGKPAKFGLVLVDTSIVWGWEAIKVDGCLGMDFASWGWVAVGTVCSLHSLHWAAAGAKQSPL